MIISVKNANNKFLVNKIGTYPDIKYLSAEEVQMGEDNSYLLLFRKDSIIGHLTYKEIEGEFLFCSIGINESYKGKGYSSRLLEKYVAMIVKAKETELKVTDFTSEGSLKIETKLKKLCSAQEISIFTMSESDFFKWVGKAA